jgi:hypothetical protein
MHEPQAQIAELAHGHVAARRQRANAHDDVPPVGDGIRLAVGQGERQRDPRISLPQRRECRDEHPTEADRGVEPHAPDRVVAAGSQGDFRLAQTLQARARAASR